MNQSVIHTILQDGKALLYCQRREGAGRREEDCIVFSLSSPVSEAAHLDISLTLEEAEAFCERAIPLVDDAKQQPLSGAVKIQVASGGASYLFSIEVQKFEDETASVALTRQDETVVCDILRPVIHRFLVGVLDALCDDLEDDD